MRDFLQKLIQASQWGASLVLVAACGSQVEPEPGSSSGSSGSTSSSGGMLEPVPAGTCYGPIYEPNPDFPGNVGQCCDEIYCTTPVDGVCASPQDAALTGLPPGSGECECGERKGPYANTDPASADTCCYLVGGISCEGRPLLIDGAPRLAEVVLGPSNWFVASLHNALQSPGGETDTDLRASLSRRWMERARFEHASIASFSRFSMALLACGAPAELIAASQRAALDEVRHAQVALTIASNHAGMPLGFGPLDMTGAFDVSMSLEDITLATVVEGCVGETLAALEVAECAKVALSETVRTALEGITEDETQHAELAWAFVRWAIGQNSPNLRQKVGAMFTQAFANVLADDSIKDDLGAPDHGFLPGAEIMNLRRKAITDVLRPAVATLLTGATAGTTIMRDTRGLITHALTHALS